MPVAGVLIAFASIIGITLAYVGAAPKKENAKREAPPLRQNAASKRATPRSAPQPIDSSWGSMHGQMKLVAQSTKDERSEEIAETLSPDTSRTPAPVQNPEPLNLFSDRIAEAKKFVEENTNDPASLAFAHVELLPGKWVCQKECRFLGQKFDEVVYVKYRAKNQFGALQLYEIGVLFQNGELQGSLPREGYLISEELALQQEKELADFLDPAKVMKPPRQKPANKPRK